MSKKEQVEFSFSVQYEQLSQYGVLFSYLKKEANISKNSDSLLHPLVAFWLPLAYKKSSDFPNISEEEIKRLALCSIEKLKAHIQLLAKTFELLNLDDYYSKRALLKASTESIENFEEFVNEDAIINQFS